MRDIEADFENDFEKNTNCKHSGHRKTGRAYRRLMKKHKKDRLMKIIQSVGYNPAAGYVEWDEVDGKWQPVGKYIKYPKNSNMQRYLKRQSSKKARRSDLPLKGNEYRKHSEYWWILY